MDGDSDNGRFGRTATVISAAAALAAAGYVIALAVGAISAVGYDSGRAEASGMVSDRSGLNTTAVGLPLLWLREGAALRADYDVDAEFGALELWVGSPPWRTWRAATANIAGKRDGSMLFVAKSAGWYRFWVDPSPIGGPRCHPPGTTMLDILKGSRDCPTYKLRYAVTWRLANGDDLKAVSQRVALPAIGEPSVYAKIGN
jgi:hypothetical protein